MPERIVNYSSLKEDFMSYINDRGIDITRLVPDRALELLVNYYKDIRVAGCEIDLEQDMLLYQWGTYDWGEGLWFEFEITRQITVEEKDEYAGMYQLHLTLKYRDCDELSLLDNGCFWCSSLFEVDEFKEEIMNSDVMKAIVSKDIQQVSIIYEQV